MARAGRIAASSCWRCHGCGFSTCPIFLLTFGTLVLFWASLATSWNILSGYSGYYELRPRRVLGVGVCTTAVLTTAPGVGTSSPPSHWRGGTGRRARAACELVAFRLRSLHSDSALLTLAVPRPSPPRSLDPSVVRESTCRSRHPRPAQWIPGPGLPAQPGNRRHRRGRRLRRSALAPGLGPLRHPRMRRRWRTGVPTFRNEVVASAITAFIAGMAGSVSALQIGYVTVEGITSRSFRDRDVGAAGSARRCVRLIVTLRGPPRGCRFEGYGLIILGSILVLFVVLAGGPGPSDGASSVLLVSHGGRSPGGHPPWATR